MNVSIFCKLLDTNLNLESLLCVTFAERFSCLDEKALSFQVLFA